MGLNSKTEKDWLKYMGAEISDYLKGPIQGAHIHTHVCLYVCVCECVLCGI